MANNTKRMKDPTEATMAAIQEALNVPNRDPASSRAPDVTAQVQADTRPEPILRRGRKGSAATTAPDESLFEAPSAIEDQPRRPANDDRASIGQILQAIQPRPIRSTWILATVCSVAWFVGAIAVIAAYLPEIEVFGRSASAIPAWIALGTVFFAPIAFFYALAHMVARSRELRIIAQSMAEVAIRLAEPEAVARESIVTVGQAIRREVAAMGDGVERALARAAELEALVHNEVSALERAYNDNEVRIRGLLEGLAQQRDNLVSQAEQVREAITNVHLDLGQDITSISDVVAERVNETAAQITRALAEKGEHITGALGRAGDSMIDALGERGGDLLERLERTSQETSRAIASASERMTSSLDFRTDHISEEFAELSNNLTQMMTARLDRVSKNFAEKSTAIVDMMADRSQEMTNAIIDTSSQMAETIATRADDVNNTLKATGDSIVLDLSLRGGDVVAKLEQIGQKITDTIVTRGTNVSDTFRESAENLTSTVTAGSDTMQEMLATRLQAFEEMFTRGGAELAEKIGHDSQTLGNLITRHLGEFDRTVKTYGGDLVEKLGERTQNVTEAMRSYVDNFDDRVTARTDEVSANLDQRLSRFQEALDSRTQTLNDSLGARVMEIARTLADGGKEVVTALDKRVNDVAGIINTRGATLAETLGSKIEEIDRTLGARATEVADTLDNRIGRFEDLLIGRAEAVTTQIEVRTRAAADALNARMEQLSLSIKSNTGEAERSLTSLTTSTAETIRGNTQDIERSLGGLATSTVATIRTTTQELERSLGGLTTSTVDTLRASTQDFEQSLDGLATSTVATIRTTTQELERSLGGLTMSTTDSIRTTTNDLEQSLGGFTTSTTEALKTTTLGVERSLSSLASSTNDSIRASAQELERTLTSVSSGMSTALKQNAGEVERSLSSLASSTNDSIRASAQELERTLTSVSSGMSTALKQNAGEVERTLLGVGAEVARGFVGKADEIASVVSQRAAEMTRILDGNSSTLLTALTSKSAELAGQITAATAQAVGEIEHKGFAFTKAMLGNSEQIARLINAASENATQKVGTTLKQLQDNTKSAIEQSQQTASAAVTEMVETQTMLRSDTTTLFERLREANILLQEVLSGAHENMSSLEKAMVSRMPEFVATMTEISDRSDAASHQVGEQIANFHNVTTKVVENLGELAAQFDSHGRVLVQAVELIDRSNRRTEDSLADRRQSLDTLIATLDVKTEDLDLRLKRFSGLLDELLEGAATRARDIARIVAETSSSGATAIAEQFEFVRQTTEEQRKRTSETLRSVYEQSAGDADAMFRQSAERFTDVLQGMKQMAAEMQRELDATRTELRRGILELPQETSESAAQMRRVIVDQIEALAELNRIVARHGRSLDTAEPVTRRSVEPALAVVAGGRSERQDAPRQEPPRQDMPRPTARADIPGAPPPRRAESPSLSPIQNGPGRSGAWLTDLLHRASRDETDPAPRAEAPRADDRVSRPEEFQARHSIESLDSLSVDIARMIDHDAAAELWDRYNRGERNVFTRRLYTLQGQKAFDEIRKKYRADREFKQTVDRYIAEFERLLDEVARGDRGQVVARTYLTSETGKVYTMLAHAAGRFE